MPENPLLAPESAPDEQLVWLEDRLAEAAAENIVRPLPTEAAEFSPAAFAPGHLRVLRNRLYRLGYLPVDSGADGIDTDLRAGVTHFQLEARLVVDGWLGVETWQALQELFAFEPPTELRRWLDGGVATPALTRAAHLRLSTLGLIEDSPGAVATEPWEALGRWARVLGLLGLEIGPDLGLVRPLFDLDTLLVQIARRRRSIARSYEGATTGDRAMLRRVLTSLVKIDLWLLGYERVEPDGKLTLIRRSLPDSDTTGGSRYRYSKLYQAIREFWKDQGLTPTHGKTMFILLRTIAALETAHGDDRERDDERHERAAGLATALEEVGPELRAHWREMSLGARIWDGVRRVWRFLTGLAKRVVNWVREKLAAVLRVAYRAASDAYSLVARGIRGLTDSVSLLLEGAVTGSNRSIGMCHDGDFDFRAFVAVDATREEVDLFRGRLRERLSRLHVTMRVLRRLLTTAIAVAQALFGGPWGWWQLVKTLVRLFGEIRDEEVRAIRAPLPV